LLSFDFIVLGSRSSSLTKESSSKSMDFNGITGTCLLAWLVVSCDHHYTLNTNNRRDGENARAS
jgi:hypothetical protein